MKTKFLNTIVYLNVYPKIMNNLSTLLLFCLLTALFSCRDSPVEQPPRPNVIIILTDDQGWGDLSINGNTNIRTPNIDRLAEGGTRMDRFYVAPVCAPTRAGFLTGRYHFRTGVFGVTQGDEYMNTDEVTLADIFKKGGYATGCFGKWHNGSQYPYHPNGRGFDEFYGFTSGHWANYFNTTLDHNGKDEKTEGYINDVLTDKALEFIDDNKEKPFLCYIPYNTPHSPFQVPDQYYDTLKNRGISLLHRDPEKEHLGTTIAALAMCEN
ncbi:MAG: sulfatase-like hydrolase/transferase, partial [Cyclobacteriaceae bacterium]|nr:sulfatase-like hydrolase/transferase [Cyclobacteriaceae bacterium]